MAMILVTNMSSKLGCSMPLSPPGRPVLLHIIRCTMTQIWYSYVGVWRVLLTETAPRVTGKDVDLLESRSDSLDQK